MATITRKLRQCDYPGCEEIEGVESFELAGPDFKVRPDLCVKHSLNLRHLAESVPAPRSKELWTLHDPATV